MEPSKDPISVRITRLNKLFLKQNGNGSGFVQKEYLSREGLLDALVVLYDECNNETLKRDKNIANFVNKFRGIVTEVRRLRVNLADFEVRKVIGRGQFGEVQVVREKQTGDVYAMKILRKTATLSKEGTSFYQEERDIMSQTQSPWLTLLKYSFQDMNNLYLVMEFHPGGDLVSLLERYDGKLSEEMARFYIAELAMAIYSLHNMGYVHRDVKPDNILIDRCGHLKLADFGSAARLTASGAVTSSMAVGTPEYIAPEVLLSLNTVDTAKGEKRELYGIECDYWSLGIVAYELTLGQTPFSSDNLVQIYHNILNYETVLEFPGEIPTSADFRRLVSELIIKKENRLNHEKLLKHVFFSSLDWAGLRESVPPFVPVVNSEDDTSNFVEFERETPVPSIENFKPRKEFSGKDLPFVGFSYTPALGVPLFQEGYSICDRSVDLDVSVTKKKDLEELQWKLQQAEEKLKEMHNLTKTVEGWSQKLKTVEEERTQLEIELLKSKQETQGLKRTLNLEHEDRKMLEVRALRMITDSKVKWEKRKQVDLQELKEQLETKESELVMLTMEKEEIVSKMKRMDEELRATQIRAKELQNVVDQNQNKIAKVRETTRMSIAGVETRLEKINADKKQQIETLQLQLETQMILTSELQKRLDECKSDGKIAKIMSENEKLLSEREVLRQEVQTYKEKYEELERVKKDEFQKLNADKESCLLSLEEKLDLERTTSRNLREQLAVVENEISKMMHEERKSFSTETEWKNQFALFEIKCKELQTQCQVQNEEKLFLVAQKAAVQEKVEELENACTQLKEQVKKLQEINAINKTDKPGLETANAEIAEEKKKMEDEINDLKAQLKTMTDIQNTERENFKSIRTELWKKDRELTGVSLDLRIAQRQARTAQETITALQEEKRKLIEDRNVDKVSHAEELRKCWEKIETLRDELKDSRIDLEKRQQQIFDLTQKLEVKKKIETELTHALKDKDTLLQGMRNDTEKAKGKKKDLECQVTSLQSEIESMKLLITKTQEDYDKLKTELEQEKNNYQTLDLNFNVLKGTCNMLEEQLEDYEKLSAKYEEKQKQNKLVLMKQHVDIEDLEAELRTVRQIVNEEKISRQKTEDKLAETEMETSELRINVANLQAYLDQYKSLAEDLTETVKSLEEKYGEKEMEVMQLRRTVKNLEEEKANMIEQLTHYITTVQNLRESSFKIGRDLEEAENARQELRNRLTDVHAEIEEQRIIQKHREIKAEATIQQQIKLIDFLQRSLQDHSKKKKTLAGRLFGRQKENVAPNVIPTVPGKDIENQLARERERVKCLTQQLEAAREQLASGKTSESAPSSTQLFFSQLVQPSTPQLSTIARRTPASVAHHNIPHRFEPKLSMRMVKCVVCLDSVHFGRHAAICKECGVTAHTKCSLEMPNSCGLPVSVELGAMLCKTEEADATDIQQSPNPPALTEGIVKLPRPGHTGWENKYLRLTRSTLTVFASKEKSGEKPDDTFELCPPDGCLRIMSAVPYCDVLHTPSDALGRVLKIEIIPRTACWPASVSLFMMALSYDDKRQWVEAFESLLYKKNGQNKPEKDEYSGTTLVALSQTKSPVFVEFFCSVELKDKYLLLGSDEGLFCLRQEDNTESPSLPTFIKGLTQVHQIVLLRSLQLVVMIAGRTRNLVQTDYKQLEIAAQFVLNPSVVVEQVLPTSMWSTCCHLFAASTVSKENPTRPIFLCVAATDKIILLKARPDQCIFTPVKVLETSEPCSCIHFTPHSVIVGCNKFFEVDLKNFYVEEFLDNSDPTLAYLVGNEQLNNFPLAILDVSPPPEQGKAKETEYLLCYNALGVFVDQYGRRTRADDAMWSHLPLAFVYRQPYIIIFHSASVEIMKLSPESFTQGKEATDSSSMKDYPQQVFVEFDNPSFLGLAKKSTAIYLTYGHACYMGSIFVKFLDAVVAYKDIDQEISLIESDSDRFSEFSFTPSLLHSLDEGPEDENDESLHVRFKKSTTTHQ